MKTKSNLPTGWWKHPSIDFGLSYLMPYIWLIYWLITWDDPRDPWAKFNIKNLRIEFYPD